MHPELKTNVFAKDISLFSLLKLHTVKTRLQDVEERLEMGADIHEKDHVRRCYWQAIQFETNYV